MTSLPPLPVHPAEQMEREAPYAKSEGYALAMQVLQSDLYAALDESERAECDEFIRRGQARSRLSPPPEGLDGGDLTPTARQALAWVLWHHQGGSSKVGQPIRFALGLGEHERMPDWMVDDAKKWEGLATPPALPSGAGEGRLMEALDRIAQYTGEGPSTTDWRAIVKTCGQIARDAIESKARGLPAGKAGEPSEIEMHRADHAAVQAAGFHDAGELLSAYKHLAQQDNATRRKVDDLIAEITALRATLPAADSVDREGVQPTDAWRMDWLERQHVEVRTPLRHGSRANFHACPDLEEDRSDLRARIDAAAQQGAPK